MRFPRLYKQLNGNGKLVWWEIKVQNNYDIRIINEHGATTLRPKAVELTPVFAAANFEAKRRWDAKLKEGYSVYKE